MIFDTFHKAGAVTIIVLLTVMVLGRTYYVREIHKLETQITVLHIEANEAEIAALEQQRSTEREWQQKADAAASAAAKDLADVEANYQQSIDDLYALLADYDTVQLSGGDSSGGNTSALPAASGTTGGLGKPTACKCGAAGGENLKNLSRDIMTLARDCDINDKYLRRWAEFYDGLRKQQ